MSLNRRCNEDWCYQEQLPDWKILKGCCAEEPLVDGRNGDIDGFIHQSNSILFLEQKSYRDDGTIVRLSGPLIRAFTILAKQGNSAIALWYNLPDASDTIAMAVWGIDGYHDGRIIKATILDVRRAARKWWRKNYRGKLKPNPLDDDSA